MNIQELDRDTIDQRFAALFEQVVGQPEQWAEADLVYQEHPDGDGGFGDVEFMMARDLNGNSYLYSSEQNGSHFYSVVAQGAEFFTIK